MKSIRNRKLLVLLGCAVLLAGLTAAAAWLLQEKRSYNAGSEGASESGRMIEDWSENGDRLKKIIKELYAERGKESNKSIRKWIEKKGAVMVSAGLTDESEIYNTLQMELNVLRSISDPKDIKERIQQLESSVTMNGLVGWSYDQDRSAVRNRIDKYLLDHYGGFHVLDGKTPRGAIEILVEGMDDLTAAKYLVEGGQGSHFPEAAGERWWGDEREYAAEYADRALRKDPTSRDALLVKLYARADEIESARALIEHHPDDDWGALTAARRLFRAHPEEAAAALERLLPEDGMHSRSSVHMILGNAYERLDMLYEAADQFQKAYALGSLAGRYRYGLLEQGDRGFSSIWEERAAAAAAELAGTPQPTPPPEPPSPEGTAPPPDPHDGPPPPTPPEDPPQPPADAERELADAYAQFAEAYRSAFEAEYGPPADTPEGRMSALLGMARAFAKAGDAEQAQAAYNEARKRYTRGQVQEAFRRLDEAERLRRQQRQEQEEARQEMREEDEER